MRAGVLPAFSGHWPLFGAAGTDRSWRASCPAPASNSAACRSRALLACLRRKLPSRASGCRPEAQP